MPEGDTIYRTALQLRRVLQGKRLRHASSPARLPGVEALVGKTVRAIEARGKHLLQRLDDRVIHSHSGMTGSWHAYLRGKLWKKPRDRAALVLVTDRHEVVCFYPKLLEILTLEQLRRHPYLGHLGPDVLDPQLDPAEVLRRFRAAGDQPVGQGLVDQTVLCGVGNIYKSELLFLERIDPFALVSELPDGVLLGLVSRAQEQMRRNLVGGPRRTRGGPDLQVWVYRRNGEPCLRCGDKIQMRRQGPLARSTYFCPGCQIGPATTDPDRW